MASKKTSRRTFLKTAAAGTMATACAHGNAAERPNVLFICVDDLRPQLPCYGKDFMITPNLDRLAARSAVFQNHFVQVPTCGASRCSMLTGLRPRNAAARGNGAFHALPREETDAPISMPELFQRNGYTTVSIGKVSHAPNGRRHAKPSGRLDKRGAMIGSGPDDHAPELAHGWDRVYGPTAAWDDPWSAFFGYAGGGTRSYTADKSPATEAADVPDTGYPDGLTAQAAVEELHKLKGKPFFLATGFYKPHLPFCAPKRYWDRYDPKDIPLATHPNPPKNVDPALSLHRNGEMTGRYAALGDPAHATPEEARHLRHAYFACVSYVDAQIGKLLDTLDELGLRENTIVVVWGDHGWHLGDLHVWGKHTTFEFSLRSALLMHVPGRRANGHNVHGLVESLDLYPTLASCCGIEGTAPLDGLDLAPLLDEPARPGKTGAFGYWQRGKNLAKTVRTERYRLVEWTQGGKPVQTELYDHQTDPDETANIAAGNADTVAALHKQLEAEQPTLGKAEPGRGA